MRKADIEIGQIVAFILVVLAILLLVLLINGLATNTESIASFIENLVSGFF